MAMPRLFSIFSVAFCLATTACAVDDVSDEEPELDELEAEVGSLRLTMGTFPPFDTSTHDSAHKVYLHGVNQADHVDMIVGNYTSGGNSRTYDVEAFISGDCFGGGSANPPDLLPIFSEPAHRTLGPGETMYLRGDCELTVHEATMVVFFTQL
jgi:hypothetical protein